MALHNNGLLLIFARTETIAFRSLWKWGAGMLFFYRRIKFFNSDGTPSDGSTAPSVLVAFGKENIARLARAKSSGFDGALIETWRE